MRSGGRRLPVSARGRLQPRFICSPLPASFTLLLPSSFSRSLCCERVAFVGEQRHACIRQVSDRFYSLFSQLRLVQLVAAALLAVGPIENPYCSSIITTDPHQSHYTSCVDVLCLLLCRPVTTTSFCCAKYCPRNNYDKRYYCHFKTSLCH